MSAVLWYLLIGSVVAVAGVVRMLLARDPVGRLVAVNVVGAGAFLIILALAARTADVDPVLAALVITGLVITAAFTGLAAVLIRRIESPTPPDTDEHDDGASSGDRADDHAGGG